MSTIQSRPLDAKWKAQFDLSGRQAPDLFESVDSIRDTPHAGAIRATLQDLGASAVFCVQGVPTIVFSFVETYDRDATVELHAALWNQGLANLLLVLADDCVRAFSLARTPQQNPGDEFDRRCLIDTLDATADALRLKEIIYGAESGRWWDVYADYFKPRERIDQVLLDNLKSAHEELVEASLSSDAAQALLIQTMFIAYLEDREITATDYFQSASNQRISTLMELLESENVSLLKQLFVRLRDDFNGDLFVAPCSFEPNTKPPKIEGAHLGVLARFRSGREEMAKSQLRFWGYNFKHIPVELISAVYDRFLGEREAERRDTGAYYTPMFLADTVVSQVWDLLPPTTKESGEFLDPACGSGVFLVRSFQRLCEHWRETRTSKKLRWDSLIKILERLHGWDLNGSAVRVAVFSLYIALLEEVSPPDIQQLVKQGKVLPELWGKTLRCQDFFSPQTDERQFAVMIGNPPWASRRNPNRSSIKWCTDHQLPMPSKEDAWAFTWKALRHVKADGIVAFLLPAMGFLHSNAPTAVEARNLLLREGRLRRVINFADLRFQLFDAAVRPTALIIYSRAPEGKPPYRFDYWAPKADLNLKTKRLITLTTADKSWITSIAAASDPLIFKRRLWMSEPAAKLFSYLSALPKIGDLVLDFGTERRTNASHNNPWMIGQGFQPYHSDAAESGSGPSKSDFVAKIPFIPINAFQPLAQSVEGLKRWTSSQVRRKGFERGFEGPRILVPRGVSVSSMRLRASYIDVPATFQDIIQAIAVPEGQERKAKLLTGILNSRVAIWFAFHGTASFGSERPEVKQAELVRLPFPAPSDLPDPERAKKAAKAIVAIIDKAMKETSAEFELKGEEPDQLRALDRHAYDYFCLSANEVILIDDAVEQVLPAVQPSQGTAPEIWKPAAQTDRQAYAQTLAQGLKDWFKGDQTINIRLEASNADLALMSLTLVSAAKERPYVEENSRAVRDALSRLFASAHQPLPGNFQLMPDFRLFVSNHLYLVKPTQKRFWLRSSALADAHSIALDIQDFAGQHKRRENAK